MTALKHRSWLPLRLFVFAGRTYRGQITLEETASSATEELIAPTPGSIPTFIPTLLLTTDGIRTTER